jgi:hypothetical protein
MGILAGFVGSAVGAWLWSRRRTASQAQQLLTPPREHGTVIFHNTPQPAEGDIL